MSESKKNPSVDTRQKLRDANLGKKHSEESKKKMSDVIQIKRWAKWREENGSKD
jgi:methionine aminopeptidase